MHMVKFVIDCKIEGRIKHSWQNLAQQMWHEKIGCGRNNDHKRTSTMLEAVRAKFDRHTKKQLIDESNLHWGRWSRINLVKKNSVNYKWTGKIRNGLTMLRRKWVEELWALHCLLLKNTPLIKMFQCLYNSDYANVELKDLRVKVCNQNILVNAKDK